MRLWRALGSAVTLMEGRGDTTERSVASYSSGVYVLAIETDGGKMGYGGDTDVGCIAG